ncbi:sodium/bile acid cotransporter 7 [Salpingoeca rosetta]|uniref:Sodium/bile acid cotransporter 7 n=1 Tax=Salpingoeca rosetta (strain ATCC 50818 / BSB-021) TaxID=946362 RepID=F2U8T5_SALR5|nr:sodium/bile acid cotransporter 7 [Salpingoeca rosetta]EGD72793.1 sodium/bile acid cotransporter 7 [Salpingoeca rosetta]|eukprot:XP_004994616.1 sodium/bile acid cotransporter 7 [Salpingoeca rosetta]
MSATLAGDLLLTRQAGPTLPLSSPSPSTSSTASPATRRRQQVLQYQQHQRHHHASMKGSSSASSSGDASSRTSPRLPPPTSVHPGPPSSSPNSLVNSLRKHWFLVGLVASILFARAAPDLGAKGGPLMPEYTVKYGAVFLIFFNSGLTLKTEELKKAAMQWSVHTMIQGFTLGVVPLFMSFVVAALRGLVDWNPAILTGLSVLSCLPPPVSSAVILTSAAGGNEAAAIFNSAFGSFLGIVATPLLLFTVVGQSAGVPVEKIFMSLTATVVVPLILGQVVRFKAWTAIKPLNIPFSTISSSVLLLIIYSTFCQTFKGICRCTL